VSSITPRRPVLLATILSIALVAAACGSAEEGAGPGAGTAPVGAVETDITVPDDGDPVTGGRLTYGIEADSDGFNPIVNRFAISGMMVALAVYDPLTALDANAEPQPYLAESLEPNDDYTVWTITLRDGVTFHDGQPLTAEAVKATLEGHKESVLTASAVTPIESVDVVDPLTAQVNMSQAWVAFPSALTAQVGFIPSPTMVPGQPGFDEELNRTPVGTGPFEFVNWTPGTSWQGRAYDGYWREGLPYLAEVEFRTLIDPNARFDALVTGQVDIKHTTNPDNILAMRDAASAGDIQLVEDAGEGEENFILLNTEEEPFNDPRVRRALALATDTDTYTEVVDSGVFEVARGPFRDGSNWQVDTDYPDFDPTEAQSLVDEIVADGGSVSFVLRTTPSPATQRATQQLQSQWESVGFDVSIETLDQTEFIVSAVTGDFEANLWRQFGAPDPDTDMVWWYGDVPEDVLDLNFARNRNPAIDAALDEGRSNPDQSAREEAYAEFQQLLAEDIPYIWLNHVVWAIGANNDVRGLTNGPLPDGQESIPLGGTGTFGGTHRLTQTWLDR